MRSACSVLIVGLAMFGLAGCKSTGRNAGLGAPGGTAAGTYEWHLNNQKNIVEEDFKDGEIGGKEFGNRIDQIKWDSFLQLRKELSTFLSF